MSGCSVCCGEAGGLQASPTQCPCCREEDACHLCGRVGEFWRDTCSECDPERDEPAEEEGT